MDASPPRQDERARSSILADHPDLRRLGGTLPLFEYVREIWRRRDFLITVPLNELRAQNQNTVLGNLWHLLNPLFLAAVFYLVFGVILGARGVVENYAAFLIIGVFTFNYTQRCTMSGARTIVSNMKLLRSLSFPRAILPTSAVMTETLAQVFSILAMFVIVALTGEPISLTWLLVVPVFAIQGFFNLGLAFATSRLTFHFRDVANFLPYVLRIWLYLSGVFFAADFVPEGWPRTLFALNPAYVYITLVRRALLEGSYGTGTSTSDLVLMAVAWAAGIAVVGFLFFRAQESEYGRG